MSVFDQIFYALHIIVFPAWALLFIAPNNIWTQKIVHSAFMPLMLGAIYVSLLAAGLFFGQSNPQAGMSSLSSVMALFSHPVGTLTGWSHFLVYDLFIGAWIARDAKHHQFSHLAALPALIFSLLFGPIGLAIYLTQRTIKSGKGLSMS